MWVFAGKMTLPNHWDQYQAYIQPEIKHACTVLGLDQPKLMVPKSPKGVHIVIVVPEVQRNTLNSINAELERTHGIKESEDRFKRWRASGIHILPVTQTTIDDRGPWMGFTTKILECLERVSSSIFVFAGTESYETSCTSKATKIILEPKKRHESPFKDSDLFLTLDTILEEREDLPRINWGV